MSARPRRRSPGRDRTLPSVSPRWMRSSRQYPPACDRGLSKGVASSRTMRRAGSMEVSESGANANAATTPAHASSTTAAARPATRWRAGGVLCARIRRLPKTAPVDFLPCLPPASAEDRRIVAERPSPTPQPVHRPRSPIGCFQTRRGRADRRSRARDQAQARQTAADQGRVRPDPTRTCTSGTR